MRYAGSLAIPFLALAACSGSMDTPPAPPTPAGSQQAVTAAAADAFIARVNQFELDHAARLSAAFWVGATYINEDSQRLVAAASAERLAESARNVEFAKRFVDVEGISVDTRRALDLLRNVSAPAPSDPELQAELATLMARMDANYGAAKWCPPEQKCLLLQEIEAIINNVELNRSPVEILEAWEGWHATSRPIRDDYARFVELINIGAREMGVDDAGAIWRSGYDMSAEAFSAEVERLWGQVEPLYEALHCHVRDRLNAKYGDAVVPASGLIPAHLLGNMWAQQWGNLYPLLEPFPGVGDLDVTPALETLREQERRRLISEAKGTLDPVALAEIEHAANTAIAVKMTRLSEDFYTSIGFPALPESFYERSLLVQPRDRDVVCHASAWNLDYRGDVRVKQCVEPTEEQLSTMHHELGHIYYYLAHNKLPPIFQGGAHDGFHEAIGDTITLSLTPTHLQAIGLLESAALSDEALINQQMRQALDKITFLPWGKLVDQWRWDVFSGAIAPAQYNEGWWALRARYQGLAAPTARAVEDFDPGAKYHIPGNTPYTRYFLAFVLQFQFHQALCEAAGHDGPLHTCSIYGNQDAGKRFFDMLALGASQPWQDAMEALTGTREMDASALVNYFAPLSDYLEKQNAGKACGWTP